MTDRQPCEPTCSQSCATPCADHPATPAEVLARFEREAVRGVCDTGRYCCRYYSWGEGPPLLLLHGLEDSAQAFVLLAARLARSFRCVAYDLPSGDRDGASPGQYTHADLVADLHALVDHLGLGQAYLFGTSLGSSIALAALHATPGRFPRAILHAPMACRPLSPWERVVARFRSHYPWSMAALPGWRRTMTRLHRGPFEGRPPELWDYFLDYRGRLPACAAGRHARLLHGVDLRPLLGEVRQPVLLVCGEVDPVVPLSATDAVLHALPAAGRVVLAGCGHVPALTHPEALAELVCHFLTPPSPGPQRVPLTCEHHGPGSPTVTPGRCGERA